MTPVFDRVYVNKRARVDRVGGARHDSPRCRPAGPGGRCAQPLPRLIGAKGYHDEAFTKAVSGGVSGRLLRYGSSLDGEVRPV